MKKFNLNYPPLLGWVTVFYIALASFIPTFGFSQSDCNSAVMQSLNIQTDYQFQAQQTEYWLYFTADDTVVDIILKKPSNTPHANIDDIFLYDGSCGSLSQLTSVSISSDSSVQYSALTINNTYYVQITSGASNSDFFGILLAAPCMSNTSLNCELPYCDLIPNGKFNDIGYCLQTYLNSNWNYYTNPANTGGNNTYQSVFKDPLNLTVIPPTTNPPYMFDNVCGWAKSIWTPGVAPTGTHPAIHVEVGNYFIRCWSYSNGMEIFHTELNKGQPITVGKYQLQYQFRLDGVQNYLDVVEIYLSDVENTYSGSEILLKSINTFGTVGSWNTVTIDVEYTQAMANGNYKYLHFKPTGSQHSTTGNSGTVCFDDIKFIYFGLSSTTPSPICEGELVEITVNGCPSDEVETVHYQWSSTPSSGSMVSFGTHIHDYPSVTTTYTCTMTTSTGVSANTDIEIVINPAPPAPQLVIESFTNCVTKQNYQISNYSTNYNWKFTVDIVGQGTIYNSIPSGQNYFNIDWSNAQYSMGATNRALVTVICSDINTNCESEFSFEVFECCSRDDPPIEFTWNDETFVGGSSQYTGEIVINGLLTIDDYQLTITNSNIYMGGLAKINILNSGSLTLVNCKIESCDQKNMWDGIYVNSINDMVYIQDNCRIYDAINNVVSNDGGVFEILDNNNFYDFYRGVVVNVFGGDHLGSIHNGNVFHGSNLALYPYLGYYSSYGIYVNDVVATNQNHYLIIGSSTGSANEFNNIETAVFCSNSDVEFINNRFQNSIIMGVEIIGNNNTPSSNNARRVKIGGLLQNEGNTFADNATNHMYNNLKTDLVFEGNTINNNSIGNTGILIFDNIEGAVSLNSNEFNLFVLPNAIFCYNNSVALNINDNTFNVNTFFNNSRLINVQNNINTVNFTATTTVNSNSIENVIEGIRLINTQSTDCNSNSITNSNQGIYISNPYDVDCNDNTYTHNNVAPSQYNAFFGISINNITSSGSLIENNSISTTNYTPISSHITSTVGIFVESAQNYTIQKNNIYRFGSGFRFKGDNSESIISCNMWDGCYHGVSLDNARIGEEHLGNYYIGSYDGSTKKSYDNEWYSNISNYRISGTVQTGVSPYYNWITDVLATTSPLSPNLINAMNLSAVISNYSTYWCGPPDPIESSLASSSINPTQLLDNKRQSMYGNRILTLPPYNSNSLYDGSPTNNNLYNEIKHIYYSLKSKTNLISLGVINDSIYQDFINTYLPTEIGQINSVSTKFTINDTIAAKSNLHSLNPNGLYGLVAHDVYNIYIKTQQNKSYILTPQDSSVLLQFAHMNTKTGGNEVYIARNLLGLYIVDNPFGLSSVRTTGITEIESNKGDNNCIVYPNPVKDKVNIELSNKSSIITQVYIYNLLGQNILRIEGKSNKIEIVTSKLDKGTYIIKVFDNENNIFQEKLIIL